MSQDQRIWILEKCSKIIDELTKLNWLLAGCQVGIHESINPIMNFNKSIVESKGKKRDNARLFVQLLNKNSVDTRKINKVADFLKTETSTDFQFMHRNWTVMLWSILENYVRDFLVEYVKRNPDVMKTEAVQKMPIRFGEYEALQGDEKYEYIVDLIESQSKLGIGVSRFEVLLGQFGLSGKVNEKLKKDILELQQVRHVLVHRNGIVDKRLVERCSWLRHKPGEIMYVDSQKYHIYSNSVANYATAIADRALKILYENRK